MQKILLSFLTVCLFSSLSIAQQNGLKTAFSAQQKAIYQKVVLTGFEETAQAHVPPAQNVLATSRAATELQAGSTIYDLQTNSTCQNRLARNEVTGELAGVWIMGTTPTAYPERGTGFNTYNNGEWGEEPTERLESERTGWPTISVLSDGSYTIISHTANSELMVSKNASGDWVESIIPSTTPSGMFWPRSVAGGPDGNTIHAMAITTPVGNDGVIYEGVDGHILYHRSLDGGTTWDIVDFKIPGIDSSNFAAMDADAYAIDANGETVAIALFNDYDDVLVAKSIDNGLTWELMIAHDFPFDGYVVDSGYDISQIPEDHTNNGPVNADGTPILTSVRTSDGTGDIIVDHDGKVHIWFGEMYFDDEILDDGAIQFYPAWQGVRYWNEDQGADSTRLVAFALDSDGSGSFNPAEDIATFFTSATSFITAGVDDENNLFIAYSSVMENFINPVATSANGAVPQHCRHILVNASMDGGETWLDESVDLIREEVVLITDLFDIVTTVYPSMPRNVGSSTLNVLFMEDFEPGAANNPNGDADPTGQNLINHIGVSLDELGFTVGTEEIVDAATFNFVLSPNPTSDRVRISYELPETSQVTLSITNMMGQVVRLIEKDTHFKGEFSTTMGVDDLSAGLYLVTFQANDQVAVQKLVVE